MSERDAYESIRAPIITEEAALTSTPRPTAVEVIPIELRCHGNRVPIWSGRRLGCTGRFQTSHLPLHFGLGAETTATVEIRWPSGRVSRDVAVNAGETVVIEEPAGSPQSPVK